MISGYIRALARLSVLMSILSLTAAFHTNAAELKGYAIPCPETHQICFWLKPVVVPPKGWIEDEDWSFRYQALFLFENGDHGTDKPVMYLHTRGPRKGETLEQFIEEHQTDWRESQKNRTIEKLADFERKNKPSFKVFLYRNPGNPEQAF